MAFSRIPNRWLGICETLRHAPDACQHSFWQPLGRPKCAGSESYGKAGVWTLVPSAFIASALQKHSDLANLRREEVKTNEASKSRAGTARAAHCARSAWLP